MSKLPKNPNSLKTWSKTPVANSKSTFPMSSHNHSRKLLSTQITTDPVNLLKYKNPFPKTVSRISLIHGIKTSSTFQISKNCLSCSFQPTTLISSRWSNSVAPKWQPWSKVTILIFRKNTIRNQTNFRYYQRFHPRRVSPDQRGKQMGWVMC